MKLFATAAAAAAAAAAYSLFEPYRFRVATKKLPLVGGAPRLSILHVSDTHMRARDRSLQRFLSTVPDLFDDTPDVVVATGDLIEDDSGIDPVVEALSNLPAELARYYVLGSHDYYQSKFQSYAKYLSGDRSNIRAPAADTARLEAGLRAAGWIGLANTTHVLETADGKLRFSGVDDPFLRRHTTAHITRERDDRLAVALVHSPDVVSEWALSGFDLILAGHTHGGQVRIPLVGALVTNCSLPTALAVGLHRVGATWLHVSPGLGTGKFAPIRFACRPEVTLLQLEPSVP